MGYLQKKKKKYADFWNTLYGARAAELQLNSCGQVKINHKLFGGTASPATHKIYNIRVSNLNNDYECKLQVFGQRTIAQRLTVTDIKLLKELENKGIALSEVENAGPIESFIGADADGLLRAGVLQPLLQGPVAIETKLGWTLSGKSKEFPLQNPIINSVCLLNEGLYGASRELTALCKLERIGIPNPIELKRQATLDEETHDHFRKNIKLQNNR